MIYSNPDYDRVVSDGTGMYAHLKRLPVCKKRNSDATDEWIIKDFFLQRIKESNTNVANLFMAAGQFKFCAAKSTPSISVRDFGPISVIRVQKRDLRDTGDTDL